MSIVSLSRLLVDRNLGAGNRHDLLYTQFPDGFANSLLQFRVVDADGFSRKAAGLQKLAQLYLKTLMTAKGSDALHPERGTSAFYALGRSAGGRQQFLEAAIRSDVADAANQVKALTTDAAASDEVLAAVRITDMVTTADGVFVSLYLESAAGRGAPIYAPFLLIDMKVNFV